MTAYENITELLDRIAENYKLKTNINSAYKLYTLLCGVRNLSHKLNRKMEDLIKALQILLKYGNPRNPSHCEHDYFYVAIAPELVSKEDIEELDKLGFFIDQEYGGEGFGSFRYGSC